MKINIAIDGPAGAGKSTIAKEIAKRKEYIYVDTGAMYRAMGLYLLEQGIKDNTNKEIEVQCINAAITIEYQNGNQIVKLNGKNVNDKIRTEEAGKMASICSAVPKVREHLLDLQRELAKNNDVVMDGRDIGTCVLPNAQLKVFLTASPDVRANRRYLELKEKGIECDLSQIKADIIERDTRDTTRETAPLKKAADAIEIDSGDLSIEAVVVRIVELLEELVKKGD